MKPAEMEALIIAQGEKIQAMQEAHMHLVQLADNIVEGFKKELAARDERIKLLEDLHDARRNEIESLTARVEELAEKLSELRDHQDGMNDTLFGAISKSDTLTARVEKIETLVLARNTSAATKRNMTDEDALRVLTGDLREISHKEAAEKIGLTYAQVYSCRLEFTFKHVHKDLRDNVKEWKNPWSK